MAAVDVTPGTGFGIMPAELLQQQMLVMSLQQHTFAILTGKSVAVSVPSEERDQAGDTTGLSYFEYLKGILLLTFLFSVLVLAVCITGQF